MRRNRYRFLVFIVFIVVVTHSICSVVIEGNDRRVYEDDMNFVRWLDFIYK